MLLKMKLCPKIRDEIVEGWSGIRSLSRHSPAAYITSLSSSGAVPLSQEHGGVLTSRIHQKVLSNKI